MVYVANTPTLYNAAIAGFFAAASAGVNPATGTVPTAVNAELVAEALVVGQAVDAAIGADATCETGGATVFATTTNANSNISRSALVRKLVYAAFQGQASISAIPAGALAEIVANIAAKYTAHTAVFYNDAATTPATVNNPALYNAAIVGIACAGGAGKNYSGPLQVFTGTVSASIAAAIDTAIGADATISSGAPNSAILKATPKQVDWNISKAGILLEICYAAFEGQDLKGITAGAQALLVAGIVAKYNSVISAPLYDDTAATPAGVHNPVLYNAGLGGYGAGPVSEQNLQTSTTNTAANAAVLTQTNTLTAATDLGIATDATITAGNATLIATAAEWNAIISKSGAMRELTFSAVKGQPNTSALPAGAATALEAGVEAQYAAVIAAPFSLL